MEANIILTPLPIADLMQQVRAIIRDELQQQQAKDLQEKLLSPAEVCELLHISKPTLWAWEKAGRIRKHTIGGRVFYKYGELMASLETLQRYKKPNVSTGRARAL